MPQAEKKTKAAQRHRRVALEFSEWLEEHPKASRKEKIQKLDQLADVELLRQTKNR